MDKRHNKHFLICTVLRVCKRVCVCDIDTNK